jgi:hypothetical protein
MNPSIHGKVGARVNESRESQTLAKANQLEMKQAFSFSFCLCVCLFVSAYKCKRNSSKHSRSRPSTDKTPRASLLLFFSPFFVFMCVTGIKR